MLRGEISKVRAFSLVQGLRAARERARHSMRSLKCSIIFFSVMSIYVSLLKYVFFRPFYYFPLFFHVIFKSTIFLSRETLLSREARGEPPPDVVWENMTLLSSFIALRRDAITTMIFFPILFCSCIYSLSFSLFVLFSFNKLLTKNLKTVVLGPTHGFWPLLFLHVRAPP